VLPELSDADLEKLGVSRGHRKKLLRAIAYLQAGGPGQRGAAPRARVRATALVRLFAARERALSALGRGQKREEIGRELERLRRMVRQFDYRLALPPIERALATETAR
jgi:SAM domain (Sterile alpha motif)